MAGEKLQSLDPLIQPEPTCSRSDTSVGSEPHQGFLGGKESPDIDKQPISSRGGYNLDFLDEVGTEAANLCPTSPLVIKERRSSANVEKDAKGAANPDGGVM